MKKNVNYFNYEERNGVFLLIFILLLFCLFIFLQKRVLPNESNITLVYASMGEVGIQKNLFESQSKIPAESPLPKIGHNSKQLNSNDQATINVQFDTIREKSENSVDNNHLRKIQRKSFTGKTTKEYNIKPKKQWENKKNYKKREPVKSFSINSQDPMDWEQIYGIGPGYAKRIIKYQNWLGGFHSREQIKEVYGITDSFYNAFKDHLHPSEPYRKININSVEEKQIGKHPYVSWKEAKNIIRYRNHHYPIKSTDFEKIRGISDSTRIKILPYLDFSYEILETNLEAKSEAVIQKDTLQAKVD